MATMSGAKRPRPNIIDTLLHEEIDSFTSLEFDDQGSDEAAEQTHNDEVAPSGDFVDPRAWADDPDWTTRRSIARRATNGRRATGAVTPPVPPPVVEAALARPSYPVPHASGLTPPPERLADALEPAPPAPSPASPARGSRWAGKGVLIGVVIGAAAIGALFAALLARH
jgi:hypothetical protein